MNFTTKIPIPRIDYPISYDSKIVSLGSCFAVNMAEKFNYFKFQAVTNPFGILFHPLAIEKFIRFAVSQKEFTAADIFFHNERWHCFDAHSDLSDQDAEALLKNLNRITRLSHQQITEASHIIITYGTSWVYRNTENDAIVANCHKVPQKQFSKELLSIEGIQDSIKNTVGLIQKINPNCRFIFTVSPVRHIKDGFVENQLSKAHLISAIHNSKFISHDYFPSYEIMMDELRDYRFYAQDMLHPNQTAIDYIWERFRETAIAETAFATMDEIENIQKGLAHKPFNLNSASHQQFLNQLQNKMAKLVSQYSFMKF